MPVRTCVACRGTEEKQQLIRLVRSSDGIVVLDPTGRALGRGAYLHPSTVCLETARKRRALERALKAALPDSFWSEIRTLPPMMRDAN
jgi:predicted RNA-binding protein YlxR (DUF448 family)